MSGNVWREDSYVLSLLSPLSLFKRNSTLLPGPEVIVWGRLGSPLVNILFRTKLLSLIPLSWDMDCLLTLWPLLIPCSLGNSYCVFGFLKYFLKYVYYHIWKRSPVQVQCMRQGAQGWCTGMTQRDRMGGGFRMGNTCTLMAHSCQCIAKLTVIL